MRAAPLLLIVNPHATAVSARVADRVAGAIRRLRELEVVRTDEPGEATAIARRAAREAYAVVAVLGGDGTLNEAANGLEGSGTALACLPGGRTNVLCRTLGLSDDPQLAVERLLAGDDRRRRVDLGTMNDRRFAFAAGLGLTAGIIGSYDRRPELKRRLGNAYFAAAAAYALADAYVREPPRLRVRVGDLSIEGVTAVLQNSDPLTYLGRRPIRVCEGAGLSTGTLSLALLTPSRARELATVVPRVISGNAARVLAHPRVEGFAAVTSVEVESLGGRPFPVEVDGDYVGDLDRARYGVIQGALELLVPAAA